MIKKNPAGRGSRMKRRKFGDPNVPMGPTTSLMSSLLEERESLQVVERFGFPECRSLLRSLDSLLQYQ